MRLLRRRDAKSAAPLAPSWGVPGRFNFTRDVVEELAADPLLPALTYVDEEGIVDRRTFAELAGDAARWAHLLRSRADAGDCVVVVADHAPGWHALLLGALKGGVVVSPAVATIGPDELARRVQLLRPALVVADRVSEGAVDGLAELRAAPPVLYLDDATSELRRHHRRAPTEDTGALDPALVVFGEGPDALPVVHHHASTWAARSMGRHWLGAETGDLVWIAAPTDSVELLWGGVLAPWSSGAEVLDHALPFEPEERMSLVQRLGVTALGQSADEHARLAAILPELPLLDHRLDRLLSFGEPLEPAVAEALLEELGVRVDESLGLPELPLLVGAMGDEPPPPGALGSPLPGHELDVIDANGMPAADGDEGELVLLDRPPLLFLEYLSMPEASAATLTGDRFHTGVRAVRDEHGVLWPAAHRGRGEAEAPREVDRAARVAAAAERARIAEEAERERRERDERERREAAIRAEEERARQERAALELAERQEREARESAARAEEEQRRLEQERLEAERRAEEERRRHEEAARELAARQEQEAREAEERAAEERRATERRAEEERREAEREAARAAEIGRWLTAEEVERQKAEQEAAERLAREDREAQALRDQQERAALEAERRERDERERQERAERELAKQREREAREAARDAERERKRLEQEAREAAKRAEAERKRHEQLERELAKQREREEREAAKRAEDQRKRQEREERDAARRAEEERRRLEREARRAEERTQRGRRGVQPSVPEPGDDVDDTPIPDVAERLRYYGSSASSRPPREQSEELDATDEAPHDR